MILAEQIAHLLMYAKTEGRLAAEKDDELALLSAMLSNHRRSTAQLFQDIWALFRSDWKRGGYFVEFGASDGLELSNTFLLEDGFGWQGLLAEPNPVFHEALRKNRHCAISTYCVAARSGETVEFNQTSEPWYSTMHAYSASDHHAEMRAGGTLIPIETRSLVDLLKEVGAPRTIDYLSLDTEGSEFDILAAFDFSLYDIRLITVEHNYGPQRGDIRKLLLAHGYRQDFAGNTTWDDWYIKT